MHLIRSISRSLLVISATLILLQCGEKPSPEPAITPSSESAEPAPDPASNTPAPESPKPQTDQAPQPNPPAPSTKEESGPVEAADYTLRTRFEGYAVQASPSMWFKLAIVPSPSQFALFVLPTDANAGAASPVPAGGPKDIALGIHPTDLRTGDGRPLIPGRSYQLQLSKTADSGWSLQLELIP